MHALQGSLWDQVDEVGLRSLGGAVQRIELTDGAWLDLRPGWLTGADTLFERLDQGGSADVEWRGERRVMWDKELATPRLLRFYREGERLPDPVIEQARVALTQHYNAEPFATVGMCLYRDHRDSVAWHGDRFGRGATHDTMVAIVSIGAPRAFLMRPAGGGSSRRFVLGHGDLIVMGGSAQRTWEHAVPKSSTPTGPRISLQFRPKGVR